MISFLWYMTEKIEEKFKFTTVNEATSSKDNSPLSAI